MFHTQVRVTQLESLLISKDKEIEGLQRMLDGARCEGEGWEGVSPWVQVGTGARVSLWLYQVTRAHGA